MDDTIKYVNIFSKLAVNLIGLNRAEEPDNCFPAPAPDFFFQAAPAPDFFPSGSGIVSWYFFQNIFSPKKILM